MIIDFTKHIYCLLPNLLKSEKSLLFGFGLMDRKYQEQKEWVIKGFTDDIKEKIDITLMGDRYSYWFRYRSIPWYRKRRIKGISPKELIEEALNELKVDGKVRREKKTTHISSYWLIEANSRKE